MTLYKRWINQTAILAKYPQFSKWKYFQIDVLDRTRFNEWPTRSTDLNPLDFFLWGYLKSLFYAQRPNNLEDLCQRIIDEVETIYERTIDNPTVYLYFLYLYIS